MVGCLSVTSLTVLYYIIYYTLYSMVLYGRRALILIDSLLLAEEDGALGWGGRLFSGCGSCCVKEGAPPVGRAPADWREVCVGVCVDGAGRDV